MCMKIYELDPSHFLTAPVLAWQACLKETEVKLKLITDLDMLLMIEEGIKGGKCHAGGMCHTDMRKQIINI